ncbi:MAG: preprotein translocase subunit YajC [Oscillospiraceae bacterium]|nr:preprotein translocase subunit YajC [Oscillospiraceae bacterium]
MPSIMMIVIMIAIFYFLLIRPENKKKKAMESMRNALKVGDKITTIGGIVGEVVHVKDESIVIETSSDRVRMELAKWSVSSNETAEKAAAKEKEAALEVIKTKKAEKKK